MNNDDSTVFLTRDDIDDNVAVFKINRSYYDGMSAQELYDCTRAYWRRSIDSVSKADYALSVVFGIVKEVYNIVYWVPACEANCKTREYDPVRYSNRIAFFGKVADNNIRNKYIGKSVANLYKYGDANPVKLFVNE